MRFNLNNSWSSVLVLFFFFKILSSKHSKTTKYAEENEEKKHANEEIKSNHLYFSGLAIFEREKKHERTHITPSHF